MQTEIKGGVAFSYLEVSLEPGESLMAEADAMSSMDPELSMRACLNGGLFSALAKKLLGRESLFVSTFANVGSEPRRLTLAQKYPGQMRAVQLGGQTFCLQPGAFVACTPGLQMRAGWAGVRSLLAREGLFRLEVSGHGTLWYGAYGALVEQYVDGETLVDSSHLVAYESQMRLRLQLAGGLFSSLLGGEGLVTRIEGKGWIVLQTRSLRSLAEWLNPKL